MILRGHFSPEQLPVYQFNYRPVFPFERLAASGLSEPIENLPQTATLLIGVHGHEVRRWLSQEF